MNVGATLDGDSVSGGRVTGVDEDLEGHEPSSGAAVNARLVGTAGDDQEGPSYRTTRYTVYPTGFARVAVPERRDWCLIVEDAGDGWVVRWRSRCLNFRYVWEFEPPSNSRTVEFLRRCRFSERAALLRAKQAVDQLVVRGMTYDEFVEHVREEAAAKARAALEAGASASPVDPHPSGPVLPLPHRLRSGIRRRHRDDTPEP